MINKEQELPMFKFVLFFLVIVNIILFSFIGVLDLVWFINGNTFDLKTNIIVPLIVNACVIGMFYILFPFFIYVFIPIVEKIAAYFDL